MPPRRSARLAAAVERAVTLSTLPQAVQLHIFSLMPVDTRLRCREVCRAWRATLEERSIWTRLDLRRESVTCFPAPQGLFGNLYEDGWQALLLAAAARAGGDLRVFDADNPRLSHADITRVAASNAALLRLLRVSDLPEDDVLPLLEAAPQLEALEADVLCFSAAMARQMLRNEAPYGRLHV
jgi:hypothetical protein